MSYQSCHNFTPGDVFKGLREIILFLRKDKKISFHQFCIDLSDGDKTSNYNKRIFSNIYYNQKSPKVQTISITWCIKVHEMATKKYGYNGPEPYKNPGIFSLKAIHQKWFFFSKENFINNLYLLT